MIEKLSDVRLEQELKAQAAVERKGQRRFLMLLAEFDRRKLHENTHYASTFEYCRGELKLSEAESYKRIQAARIAAKLPAVLDRIEAGTLHLSGLAVLAPHLTKTNHRGILRRAEGMSKRELEFYIATLPTFKPPTARESIKPLAPASTAQERIRAMTPDALPLDHPPGGFGRGSGEGAGSGRGNGSATTITIPVQPAVPSRESGAPVSPERLALVTFKADAEALVDLERARQLLAHQLSGNEIGPVIKAALKALLARIDPAVCENTRRKALRAEGRRVPKTVKAVVCKRDGGQCAYRGPDGRRCPSRTWLEYDHIVPYALGGRSDDPANIRLLCRSHNQLEARLIFGERAGSHRRE